MNQMYRLQRTIGNQPPETARLSDMYQSSETAYNQPTAFTTTTVGLHTLTNVGNDCNTKKLN